MEPLLSFPYSRVFGGFLDTCYSILCYIVVFFPKRPECLPQNPSPALYCTGLSLLYRRKIFKNKILPALPPVVIVHKPQKYFGT